MERPRCWSRPTRGGGVELQNTQIGVEWVEWSVVGGVELVEWSGSFGSGVLPNRPLV